MTITHIVLFRYKPAAGADFALATSDRFLKLATACRHPETQQPYIISIKGGKDISIENKQNGLTHGYVVEFASAADRDYYVHEDPAHLAFVESLGDNIEKATVLDFTGGVF